MKRVTSSIVLLIVVATLDVTNTQITFDTKSCNNSVLVCESPTSVGFCIQSNDQWNIMSLGDCPTGCCFNGRCTLENPHCCSRTAELRFICTATGIFPNPGDYTQYHFCVNHQDEEIREFRHKCDDGFVYNPKSTFCDKELSGEEVLTCPVPPCQTFGQTGAIKENQTLYYVCIHHPDEYVEKILYPMISACPHGEIYNESTTSCEEAELPACQSDEDCLASTE